MCVFRPDSLRVAADCIVTAQWAFGGVRWRPQFPPPSHLAVPSTSLRGPLHFNSVRGEQAKPQEELVSPFMQVVALKVG